MAAVSAQFRNRTNQSGGDKGSSAPEGDCLIDDDTKGHGRPWHPSPFFPGGWRQPRELTPARGDRISYAQPSSMASLQASSAANANYVIDPGQ